MGQLIGQAAVVSANIHASVSGVVTAVEKRLTSDGKMTMCVVIENDFADTPLTR
jgi:electron transport complex protein RnfC